VQAEKQSANTEKLARAATSEASAARVQAENTRESLRKSDEAFRLSQQPYITVGRKDGVVAELMESNDATQPVGIILYFQNSGHLPAITTCVSTRTFGTPLMNPFDYGNILIRQAGKDSTGRRRVAESSCPTVGGDTAYSFPIRPFSEQTLTQLKSNKQSDFRVHETIQYCDAFGHYFCKSAMLKYEREPISGFSEEGESDCSGYYRANPDTPNTMYGTNEQLPACPQPGEILKNQEDDMRVWGWKLLSHP
jgi:hypothetical protein